MIENARIYVQGKGAIHVVPDVMRIEVKVQSVFPTISTPMRRPRKISDGW